MSARFVQQKGKRAARRFDPHRDGPSVRYLSERAAKQLPAIGVESVWRVPGWLRPYLPLLKNTGGTFDDPTAAMNCDGRNCNVVINAPRALLCIAVQSQVKLLEDLHARGLLRQWSK